MEKEILGRIRAKRLAKKGEAGRDKREEEAAKADV